MAVTGGYDRDEAKLLMTLCGLTYIDAVPHPFESIAAQQARMLKDINTALKASPYGDWQVQWGPALDDERANMMFVAGKQDKSHLDATARGVKLSGPSLADLAAPHLKDLDPQRVRLILRSLRQLETLQNEGVSLMMPEFLVR